jgi:hypothetical protein
MNQVSKGVENLGVGEEDNKRFRVTVGKFEIYQPGSQVYIQYGKYSNRQLLIHYGFVMKENKYNYARLKVPLGYFLNERQTAALGKGYSLDDVIIFKIRAKEFCQELLRAFRSFSWNIDLHSPTAYFNPANLDLEMEAIGKMLNLLEYTLNSMQSTVEEDEQMIQKCENSRTYFAVNYK